MVKSYYSHKIFHQALVHKNKKKSTMQQMKKVFYPTKSIKNSQFLFNEILKSNLQVVGTTTLSESLN